LAAWRRSTNGRKPFSSESWFMLSQTSTQPTSPAGLENSFAALFEESLSRQEMRIGEVITAEVISVDPNVVIVNAGLKSESTIATEEFKNDRGEVEVKPGDFVSVAIEALEDGFGATKLSRDKAKKLAAWTSLDDALANATIIKGVVSGKVKGGLTVMVNGIRAFLPGSLVDLRPVKDTSHFEGKELEFKVIKLDRKRNNVVVSRRAVMEETAGVERQQLLETLKEGAIVKGVVKNITDYGAFVDLGGIDGLLHITDLAWRRVKHPTEVLSVGDEVTAKILKFDAEKNRVSLGLKQLGEDPWIGISRRYPQGTRLFGKVTNITDYGAFVEIEAGIEGLVHVSEMDWTNKNVHPAKVVSLGDEVEVMILEIDEDRRRISLGMKQCMPNPWEEFAMNHKKGDKVKGTIKSITDFGVFIGLPGNIDGLVHLSDLSWQATGEEAVKALKKGDEVETVVLSIDVERERISLGIKQLEGDPFGNYVTTHDKGNVVKGVVKSIESKGAVIQLDNDVEGYLRASEIARDRVEDVSKHLQEGQEIEAVIVNIDRKSRSINLSIKQKDHAEEQAALQKHASETSSASAGTTNLGALLKAKLGGSKDKE
jgi:small subunit ribosomal protein S1